uniref:Uncharacterized protein n=1 Tax=Cyprinus carpio carpio TaxID=630221 RepID=A0A9J7YQT8_CYPCA
YTAPTTFSTVTLFFFSVSALFHKETHIYLVTVTSQAVGGNTETLCAHIHEPKETLSIVVTLRNDDRYLTILQQGSINNNFYKCVNFKVPVVTVKSVASIDVAILGAETSLKKTTEILINPPQNLLFIQSDKPIYKPGQTIKFRIVSLDSNLLPHNQVFGTVELQDPNSNRIGQWLNQTTRIGILDLSHSMSPEAAQGFYMITAWDDKNQKISHTFEIKEYVLPKYEVNIDFPSIITSQEEEVTLKVCAKYTYGKPVLGSVIAEVCGQSYDYYDWRPDSDPDVCKKYSMMVRENIKQTDSASAEFTKVYVNVNFEDTPDSYRPGMLFNGKCVVTNSQSKPIINETVFVKAYYGYESVSVILKTDVNGIVYFSFNTLDWSEQSVSLRVKQTDFQDYAYNPSAYLYVRPFYSKSKSFLINKNKTHNARKAVYASHKLSYSNHLPALQVLSRGSMAQNGRLSVSVNAEKGKQLFYINNHFKTAALTPYAQVVVYTVLPNGEAVADSMDFPIEECLPNKVSLKFSSPTELPGERTSLNLEASPGSLCSVRAIDESVLLLKPEAELDAATVLGMLPVQILSGYPYNIEEWEPNPCPYPERVFGFAVGARRKRSRFYYPQYYNNFDDNDVYNIFKGVGIKIATNSDVKAPVVCAYSGPVPEMRPEMGPEMGLGPNVEKRTQKIRKFFPETWIWDLIPVGKSGYVDLAKTVPDTITKWAAGAFCTSRVGFGVAPKTDLTAFKPFFVSLTLPYSVIRGETFTLKATVFNYLPKCIMVKVTLADSPQFTAQPCRGCTYTQCVCSEESKTFQWTVAPSELGKVNITVRTGAVRSKVLCDNEVVTLPDKGRTDTVMQSVLVEVRDYQPQETSVSLTLPTVFVKDSAKSFVTVLGDLMGRALKNIGDLLAMPYGCGEQNMLRFAPNIYILQYLESSGQLTPEIKDQAITFLESGYQRELTYKHDDGSYSAFGRNDPSGNTWLTAFVMKSFSGAKKYIFIDQANIDQAKNWLGQQQQSNGCFASVGKLFNNMLKGGVNDEVTLSAYITAALLELGIQETDPVVAKSLACLKESSHNIDNTYVTALLSYTFTLAGDEEMRQTLLSNLDNFLALVISGVGRYWTLANNAQPMGSVEVETSAYVLLALLSGPSLPGFGLNYSAGIVHWLSKQQNANGGFSSTQDTVVALQALAKYSAATYNAEGFISITVTSPSGQRNQFTVNQDNRLLYQEKQLQEATGTYELRAEGKGCVFVQVCALPLLIHILSPRNSSSRNECFHHVLTLINYSSSTRILKKYNIKYTAKI